MAWSTKVVLITGASSGLGRGLALELARRGAAVGLFAPRPDTLREVAAEIESAGGRSQVLAGDVLDAEALRTAADKLGDTFGAVDTLIANAGIGGSTDAASLNPASVANVINVNVLGPTNSVAAVLPKMLARGSGHLVVISSLAAYRGVPKSAAYCASKAAVSALFESLRLDLEPRGIKVTIIHPGFIRTPMTADRHARLPWLLEVDDAANRIIGAIEAEKKSFAFPWQLATIVRAGMIMPHFLYDWIARRNSFRE
jgi:short-subunit dehydrogenase